MANPTPYLPKQYDIDINSATLVKGFYEIPSASVVVDLQCEFVMFWMINVKKTETLIVKVANGLGGGLRYKGQGKISRKVALERSTDRVQIRFLGQGFKLYANKEAGRSPILCYRVYVQTREHNKIGYKNAGGALILDTGTISLCNHNFNIEYPKVTFCPGKLQVKRMEPTLNELTKTMVNDIKSKWMPAMTEYTNRIHDSYAKHLFSYELFRLINEPVYGSIISPLPRSFYYLNIKDKFKAEEDWYKQLLVYMFSFERLKVGDFIKFVEKGVYDKKKWQKYMETIVSAFTTYVTRLDYCVDGFTYDNKLVQFEDFSQLPHVIGCGDCEDFALILQSIFLNLIKTTYRSKFLKCVSKMLSYYVPCSVLVNANAPSMSNVAASQYYATFTKIMTVSGLQKENKKYGIFHMTCILYPMAMLYQSVPSLVQQAKVMLRNKPWLKNLTRMYAEGTCNIFPDPEAHAVLKDNELGLIRRTLAMGRDIVFRYVERNFETAPRMYMSTILLHTDHFKMHNIGPSTSTVFLVCYKPNTFSSQCYTGVLEHEFNYDDIGKIKLDALSAYSTMEEADGFNNILLKVEPPSPILHKPLTDNMFHNSVSKLQTSMKDGSTISDYYFTKTNERGSLTTPWPFTWLRRQN